MEKNPQTRKEIRLLSLHKNLQLKIKVNQSLMGPLTFHSFTSNTDFVKKLKTFHRLFLQMSSSKNFKTSKSLKA